MIIRVPLTFDDNAAVTDAWGQNYIVSELLPDLRNDFLKAPRVEN
jgi:hypothetical protein